MNFNHQSKINEFKAKGYSTHLWYRNFIKTFYLEEEDFRSDFVPDAYLINKEENKITFIEIVKTHDLTKIKLYKIGQFWFECDSEFIDVECYTVTEYGMCKVDLQSLYYNCVLKGVSDEIYNN